MVHVPGSTAYLHPDRNPLNPNGYTATRNTPFICHVRPAPLPQLQHPTAPLPQLQHPTAPLPQLQHPTAPLPQLQPPPLPRPQLQSLTVAQQQRVLTITRLYNAVFDLVQSGSTLRHALEQTGMSERMLKRRRLYMAHIRPFIG